MSDPPLSDIEFKNKIGWVWVKSISRSTVAVKNRLWHVDVGFEFRMTGISDDFRLLPIYSKTSGYSNEIKAIPLLVYIKSPNDVCLQ